MRALKGPVDGQENGFSSIGETQYSIDNAVLWCFNLQPILEPKVPLLLCLIA